MRIVSVGFPIPDPQADNHSIANAPALFEYDACVLDLRVVSEQIEGIATGSADLKKPDGTPVAAGTTGAFHFGLGELLEQRREELLQMVRRGGLIVVMTYPNVPHPVVTTLPGATRYTIVPAAAGVAYRPPQLLPGDGTRMRALDPAHAFSPYLDDLGNRLNYRARWDVRQIPDFANVGQVFGRSEGGADVAVDFRVGAGRVVFLPAPRLTPRGTSRQPFRDSLLECIRRALESPPLESPPPWLKDYDLPGLTEAQKQLEQAEGAFAEAESRFVEARAYQAEAGKYQGLLWRDGRYALEPLVREAFRTLGFQIDVELDRPALLRDGAEEAEEERVALLEIDASQGTVSERSYLALQRRIEEEFLRSGERRKGVIVVNGERTLKPSVRRKAYAETLVNACANFGYALIPGDALFALVSYALEGADAETLAGIRETILQTEGLLAVEEGDEAEAADLPAAGPADESRAAPAVGAGAEAPPGGAAADAPDREAVVAEAEGGV